MSSVEKHDFEQTYGPAGRDFLSDLTDKTPEDTRRVREVGRKFDSGKARPSLVPPVAMFHVIDVFEFGARKYAPDNWKIVENAETRYLDALMRHVEAYRLGEYFAKDSKLPHLAHVVANALMLMELRETVTKTAPANVDNDAVISYSVYEK